MITIPPLNLCHLANNLPSGEHTGARATAGPGCLLQYYALLNEPLFSSSWSSYRLN